MENVSLLVFTCEGKEHLLPQTLASFRTGSNYTFKKVILSVDGGNAELASKAVNPDLLLYVPKRRGYVNSIHEALRLIDTKYFFWLEDDFIFNKEVPFDYLYDTLEKETSWASIFLSRWAPLTKSDKKIHLCDNFYVPEFGYSVSPALCNTHYIKKAFEELKNYPKNFDTRLQGFETFLDKYFVENNLCYAILDPGEVPHVTHFGQIESTAREYHMINSLDENISSIGKEYISGFGIDKKISLKNQLLMIPKIWISCISLSTKIFTHRNAYDFALRLYLSFRKKFTN